MVVVYVVVFVCFGMILDWICVCRLQTLCCTKRVERTMQSTNTIARINDLRWNMMRTDDIVGRRMRSARIVRRDDASPYDSVDRHIVCCVCVASIGDIVRPRRIRSSIVNARDRVARRHRPDYACVALHVRARNSTQLNNTHHISTQKIEKCCCLYAKFNKQHMENH